MKKESDRYEMRKVGQNTFCVFDKERNATILKTISPNAMSLLQKKK